MKAYLAGPMSGIKNLNFPAFHAAAAHLRALGHEVINPAELCPDQAMPWTECMKRDIAELVTCEAIVMLPGWRNSKGACVEWGLATVLELKVIFAADILEPVNA